MKKTRYSLLGFCLLSLFFACGGGDNSIKEGDRILAKVYNRSLYLSEVEALVGDDFTATDSTQFVDAYIDRWVKESLLMHEAEKNVPKNLNIDELVRDYRASLIRHSYEKLLVEVELDSVITDEELNQYYQDHREEHKLEYPVLRCFYLKVPKEAEGWKEFKEWWKDKDEEESFKKIVDYCNRNATLYMLNDSVWYNLEVVQNQLPTNTLTQNNYSSTNSIDAKDDNFYYLMEIFETVSAKEYAPIGYVTDQISKVILHKRKIKLLDDKKDEIYEKESRRSNVKVYKE